MRRKPCAVLALLAIALSAGAGCAAGGGDLSLRSTTDTEKVLTGDFSTAVYSMNDQNDLDVLLIEGPEDDPSQIVHIRMHWRPRAGRTPVTSGATNATVRYIIFTGRAAGIYDGAGFLFPHDRPGGGVFSGELRSSSLRLADSTENFVDRLGLAEALGGFSARRDKTATLRLLRQIQSRLTRELGYPRFVGDPLRAGSPTAARLSE
jgi:hypothetical protein